MVTHSSSTKAGPVMALAFVKVQSHDLSPSFKKQISLESEMTETVPSPSGISEQQNFSSAH
jgi:hypothetical protein